MTRCYTQRALCSLIDSKTDHKKENFITSTEVGLMTRPSSKSNKLGNVNPVEKEGGMSPSEEGKIYTADRQAILI